MLGELMEIFLQGSQGQDGSRGGSVTQDPLGGLLEQILGSGIAQENIGGNPLLAPFTEALSEKLGISPQMASVIINVAIKLLLAALTKSNQKGAGGQPATPNLDDLLDEDYLVSSGAVTQVAQQTGMSETEASASLQEALVMLSSSDNAPRKQPVKRQPTRQASSLDDLLDSWEVDG